MLRALLFDIDGTLMDTFDAILESMNVALQEVGMDSLTREELRPLIGRTVASQMDILRGVTGAVVDSIHETYYRAFAERVRSGVRLYPGVRETLEALTDYSIGTITTRRRTVAQLMLRVGRIDGHFTAIVGGDEVSRPKPYPDLVQRACAALNVSPHEAVAVGDSPVDILAGRSAGTLTVAVMYGYGAKEELIDSAPDATIADFRELPKALKGLSVTVSND